MVLRFGDNYAAGKDMATWHSMDFSYESIGKPGPKTQEAAQAEFDQFSAAIDQVLAGTPQHVKYRGYNQLITMSRTDTGDILVAVTPQFGAAGDGAKPAGSPPSGH
jgi:hypothetical protein